MGAVPQMAQWIAIEANLKSIGTIFKFTLALTLILISNDDIAAMLFLRHLTFKIDVVKTSGLCKLSDDIEIPA